MIRVSSAGACLALVLCLSAHAAGADLVVAPTLAVAGRSQAEWSRAWWQWAGSFDDDESPVSDPTGEDCDLRQSGPVWFLAGTYGTGRTVRSCAVPQGKYLFFPLVNVVQTPWDDETTCAEVTSRARRAMEGANSFVVDIDGHRIPGLQKHRFATTACFDLGALSDDREPIFPSAANGYYVMLKPLAPGKHVLNFGAVAPGLAQAVTYTLWVK
jgi:hypothetical protein